MKKKNGIISLKVAINGMKKLNIREKRLKFLKIEWKDIDLKLIPKVKE